MKSFVVHGDSTEMVESEQPIVAMHRKWSAADRQSRPRLTVRASVAANPYRNGRLVTGKYGQSRVYDDCGPFGLGSR